MSRCFQPDGRASLYHGGSAAWLGHLAGSDLGGEPQTTLAAARFRLGLDRNRSIELFLEDQEMPPHGERCAERAEVAASLTFYVPCGRTRHGQGNTSFPSPDRKGSSRGEWTRPHCVSSCRVVSRWMALTRSEKWVAPSGPVRLRRVVRLMGDVCPSPPTP